VRRGISIVLLSTMIMFAVLVIGFALIFANMSVFRGVSESASRFTNYEVGYAVERLSILRVENGIVIVNCGSEPATVSYVVYSCGYQQPYRVTYVNRVVEPTKSISVYLGCDPARVSVVTESGRVFTRVLNMTIAKNVTGLLQIQPYTALGIETPQQLSKIFIVSNPSLLAIPNESQASQLRGVSTVVLRGAGHYQPGRAKRPLVTDPSVWYYNVGITTLTPSGEEGAAPFGIVLIGYDPSYLTDLARGINTTPRYFIMIVGAGNTPVLYVANETVSAYLPFSHGYFSPNRWGRWRIKIWNFSGEITILQNGVPIASTNRTLAPKSPLGIWYYGYWINASIVLRGHASKVMYYFPMRGGGSLYHVQTTYDPYLAIADIDGDGIPEVVFIDEDVGFGSVQDFDDHAYVDGRYVTYLDYTSQPLELTLNLSKLTGLSSGGIPGSRYSLAYLYLQLFFHDNSWPDQQQFIDNDLTLPVFQVVLRDSSGNSRVVYSVDYQTIANYHRTLIENLSSDQKYFTKMSVVIPIYLPNPSETYWITLEIMDLYNVSITDVGIQNDADFTIGISVIGVALIPRTGASG